MDGHAPSRTAGGAACPRGATSTAKGREVPGAADAEGHLDPRRTLQHPLLPIEGKKGRFGKAVPVAHRPGFADNAPRSRTRLLLRWARSMGSSPSGAPWAARSALRAGVTLA